MDIWNSITGGLVVLSPAMILGVVCERHCGKEDLVGDKLGEAFLEAVNDPAESLPHGVKSDI